MDPTASFRLQEYRISEFGSGRLSWESHSGFGAQVGGPCYIWGDILVIGNKCSEEIGFLKSEFLDSLKKLPKWRKTRFYCPASSLLEVSNDRAVSEVRLMQKPRYTGLESSTIDTVNIAEPISYRLGHYRIRWTQDGDLHWYSSGGGRRIVAGSGVIVSDILFLAVAWKKNTEEQTGFYRRLAETPQMGPNHLVVPQLGAQICIARRKTSFKFTRDSNGIHLPQKDKTGSEANAGYHRRLWSCMDFPFFAGGHGKKLKWSIKDLTKRIDAIRNKIHYVLGLITKR